VTDLLRAVADYYAEKLRAHGPGAAGVDWNSEESQALRFRELCRVLPDARPFSLLDVGCGTGALVDYLERSGRTFAYWGCDAAGPMIEAARGLHGAKAPVHFVPTLDDAPSCDVVVASGIFNVRLEASDEVWSTHMEATVRQMAQKALRGFAFNALSLYSDPAKRRPDLYYADPVRWFDFVKRELSTAVALLHDYPLWEFTLLARR
jgi:SAM-dependent methyltransferase